MGNVAITGVEKCDGEGTALRLSVRGHEVLAFFPTEENRQAAYRIKKALVDTCISAFPGQNVPEIGQN